MDKIIFLDIDGVLNSQASITRRKKEGIPLRFLDLPDKYYIRNLNHIIHLTKAKIVITSTWKYNHSEEALAEILFLSGCNGEVIGVTPTSHDDTRGKEINKWLSYNMCKKFVIIDDDSDMDNLLPYLVKIDSKVGLTMKDVNKTIKMLED